jgi:parallel beta-helix repeat protein
MLSILAQEVLVKRCSLTGNRNISDKEYHWSGGIRIAGSTSGSVYFTNVTHCGSGIVIEGNAEIKLSFNKCVENAISGISFSESATGIAESSICCRNKEFGISVFDHSKVHLTNNHCEENEFAGISLSESSTGTVNNNTCSRNKWEGLGCGIRADGNSKVDLFGNCCEENEFSGILFSESSTGRAVNNRCNKNKGASILGCGIMIFGQSIVNLVGNCCEENHNSGISYSESASGRVENNTCRLNKKKGITIELEKADMVILKNNVCEDNGC